MQKPRENSHLTHPLIAAAKSLCRAPVLTQKPSSSAMVTSIFTKSGIISQFADINMMIPPRISPPARVDMLSTSQFHRRPPFR